MSWPKTASFAGGPRYGSGMEEFDFDCYQALIARDARFDGRFFVGVKTTGIYCRPVCATRPPRAASCVFFATAAAAEKAGFRPCLRCRPELAPGGNSGPPLAQALFSAIRGRVAFGDSVDQIADLTGYSSRQLRRLTMQFFGVTPVQILQTERLLFAKKLIQETGLPMADVALAAGFGSLRRFNALFRLRYRISPTEMRRPVTREASANGSELCLRLAYRPPLAWKEMLAFQARRAAPGVEWISPDRGAYARTVSLGARRGWVTVSLSERGDMLEVRTPAAFADALWTLLARLRALFDLDANPASIDAHLGADPLLAESVRAHPGLRVPGAWDAFELAVRAVLGQQVSVAGATTLAGRLAARFGEEISTPLEALNRLSPTASAVADASLEDIAGIGLPKARAQTIRDLAASAVRGELEFRPAIGMDEAASALQRVRGIGEWTAQYVAMRALRHPDAFPSADLGLRKALAPAGKTLASARDVAARSARWRPWRAYAALHLWQSLEKKKHSPL